MAKIIDIQASQILDSRGNPTIQTAVLLSDGAIGTSATPSGASTGTYEAIELRDNDNSTYNGLGVLKAIEAIHQKILPKLKHADVKDQIEIDTILIDLDGTPDKSVLGANAILSVSMSSAKAAAASGGIPLYEHLRTFSQDKTSKSFQIPTPLFNVINGGKHALGGPDFQEFFIIPPSSKPFHESLHTGFLVYQKLKVILQKNNLSTLVGDEGGFSSPKLETNADVFDIIKKAIDELEMRIGSNIFLGLDAASNSFYSNSEYRLKDKEKPLSSQELIAFYEELTKTYPLLYVEDPFSEDDWNTWSAYEQKNSESTIVVGDDLTVTNPSRLEMALEKKAINGIIIKPNQIGTITEALAVLEMAKAANVKTIVSHRSGETNDDFIADFAVGAGAEYVKFGAPARGERTAKYNRLLHIEGLIKKGTDTNHKPHKNHGPQKTESQVVSLEDF